MAAASGDLDLIRLLLERGTNANSCGHYYGCALQAAARFGHLKCVQFLLDTNANVNLIAGSHGTPLQAVIIGKDQEVVAELIAHGADPNNVGDGTPALHLAVQAGDLDLIDLLLLSGADIDMGNSKHSPAFVTACFNGALGIVELLLTRGANVNIRGITQRDYSDYWVIESSKASPLHAACHQGYFEIAQALLGHGADVNSLARDDRSPLGLAALGGHMDIIELLFRSEARLYDESAGLNVLKERHGVENPRGRWKFLFKLFQMLLN